MEEKAIRNLQKGPKNCPTMPRKGEASLYPRPQKRLKYFKPSDTPMDTIPTLIKYKYKMGAILLLFGITFPPVALPRN